MTDALSMSLDDIIVNQKKGRRKATNGKVAPSSGKVGGKAGGKTGGKPVVRAAPYNSSRSASSIAAFADKLTVSNLAPSVTQSDVKELFTRIGSITLSNEFYRYSFRMLSWQVIEPFLNGKGPVRSAQLNYNQDGKSKGVASVSFAKAGDAHKAYQEYNNRPLDEKPMKIELMINPENTKVKNLESRLGSTVGKKEKAKPKVDGAKREKKVDAKNVDGKIVGKKGRGGRGPKVAKKEATAGDLDADMDAYMAAPAAESLVG